MYKISQSFFSAKEISFLLRNPILSYVFAFLYGTIKSNLEMLFMFLFKEIIHSFKEKNMEINELI